MHSATAKAIHAPDYDLDFNICEFIQVDIVTNNILTV